MTAPMSSDENRAASRAARAAFRAAFRTARADTPEQYRDHLTQSMVFALSAHLATVDGGPQLLADALADVVAAELRTRPAVVSREPSACLLPLPPHPPHNTPPNTKGRL